MATFLKQSLKRKTQKVAHKKKSKRKPRTVVRVKLPSDGRYNLLYGKVEVAIIMLKEEDNEM